MICLCSSGNGNGGSTPLQQQSPEEQHNGYLLTCIGHGHHNLSVDVILTVLTSIMWNIQLQGTHRYCMAFAKHIWDAGIIKGCGGEIEDFMFCVQWLPHMKKRAKTCNPGVPPTAY